MSDDTPPATADRTVLAVDVGGTSIKGARLTADLRLLGETRRPTPRTGGPDAVVDAIADVLGELRRSPAGPGPAAGRGPVAGRGPAAAPGSASDTPSGTLPAPLAAGVVVPGIVDEAAGVARFSANLGWRDLPLAAVLGERVGLPVTLGHDVRAGALAEHRAGAGRGADGMLFLPLGFGIAGAIVADGRIVASHGYAGEVGHLVVEPTGDRCGCGQRGCLETVASAASIGRRYAARVGRPAPAEAREVAALVATGTDQVARAVWDEAVAALAWAITTVNAILAPDIVVIGGGLSLSGDLLLRPLRAAVETRRSFLPLPHIVAAELGDRAGTLGAAMLAFAAASVEPSEPASRGDP